MTPLRYLPVLLAAAVVGGAGVAQRARVIHMRYEQEMLFQERHVLADQNRRLLCDISALSDPVRIERSLRDGGFALEGPDTLREGGPAEDAPPPGARVARR